MGRIDEVIVGSGGGIREATVVIPSRRKIRRPVNLFIPFEIEDEPTEDANLAQKQVLEDQNKPKDARIPISKYNLRTRSKINYNEDEDFSKCPKDSTLYQHSTQHGLPMRAFTGL